MIFKENNLNQAQERDNTSEKEEKFNEILLRREKREKLSYHETIEDLVKNQPEEIKAKIISDIKRLENYGLSEDQLREEAIIKSREIKESYLDRRFNFPNKTFAKLETIQGIDNIFENEVDLNDLKKIARISFDLNGLKSVNDITGSHEKGDDYLKLVAETFNHKSVKDLLIKNNIKSIVSADGGDEFGVILKSEENITPEVINEFMEIVRGELYNDARASDILNFDDEEIIKRFFNLQGKEWNELDESEKKRKIENAKKEIPKGYKFKAIISSGATTLYDSILGVDIEEGDNYERILKKMMGSIFSASDKEMQFNKDDFKKGLENSDNPNEVFLSEVYSRTESEVRIRRELAAKNKIIFLQDKIIETQKGDEEEKNKIVKKLEKEIEDLKKSAA